MFNKTAVTIAAFFFGIMLLVYFRNAQAERANVYLAVILMNVFSYVLGMFTCDSRAKRRRLKKKATAYYRTWRRSE